MTACTHHMYGEGDLCAWCRTIVTAAPVPKSEVVRLHRPSDGVDVGGSIPPLARQALAAPTAANGSVHQIVTAAAPPAVQVTRGEVAPEASTQASPEVPLPATIATGVAADRKAAGGPPPASPAPVAAIADPAPTPATPCPALRLPVASHDANASHGAGSAFTAARMTDPDTAHEAAGAVTDVQRRNVYRAVLEALVEHGPSTDHDLARYVSGKLGHPIGQTSCGVRRGELRNMGLVCDSGHKGRTPTGAKAIRWALTPAGIDAVGVAA